MTNQSILQTRHSAHEFSDRPIDLTVLKEIIVQAQLAPSWEDTQPWKVYLATGQTANQIRQSHLDLTASGAKSWTEVMPPKEWAPMTQTNLNNWQTEMGNFFTAAEGAKMAGLENSLFNAPAIVYLTMPKDSSAYSAYDVGAFGYGILLAAAERGVGSLPAYELIRYPAEIRNAFDIPEEESVFMGIALGYSTDDKLNDLRTGRTPLNEILQVKD